MDAGMLLPIFSLPSTCGRGDFSQARKYVDFLKTAGFSYWQILPMNPVDRYLSPYASLDLSAGDLMLLDIHALEKGAYLSPVGSLSYEKKIAALVENLYLEKVEATEGYQDFMQQCEEDVLATGLFYLARRDYGSFRHWPMDVKRDYAGFCTAHKENRLVRIYAALSFLFEDQWKRILDDAEAKGIQVIGDLPYYPGMDNVERWVHPEHFLLDEALDAVYVSGVPGDGFNDAGQLWNSPVYNWKQMESEDFSYHRKQIRRALTRYHRIRLDHFRGYDKIFHIPRGEEPSTGHWEKVPGEALFSPWKEDRRFLIEDLGYLDKDFYQFRDRFAWPGMGVMALEGVGVEKVRPQIYYTGNHDTDPLPLYVKTMTDGLRRSWEAVLGKGVSVNALIEYTVNRREKTVFFQHGDFLNNPGRINRPGTRRDNWRWMLPPDAMTVEAANKIRTCLEERAK